MQEATQAGLSPIFIRSMQRSHLVILGCFGSPMEERDKSSKNCGAPHGQTLAQVPHPMHFSESTITAPNSGSLEIAFAGHAGRHAGSAQWLQEIERGAITTSGGLSPSSTNVTLLQFSFMSNFLSIERLLADSSDPACHFSGVSY